MTYRGRFAASPSGALHPGSLLVTVGNWLRARSQCGAWIVRMEDLDPAREMPGAARAILDTLAGFGLSPMNPCGIGAGTSRSMRRHSTACKTLISRLPAAAVAAICRRTTDCICLHAARPQIVSANPRGECGRSIKSSASTIYCKARNSRICVQKSASLLCIGPKAMQLINLPWWSTMPRAAAVDALLYAAIAPCRQRRRTNAAPAQCQ